jgi:hypothetical protein
LERQAAPAGLAPAGGLARTPKGRTTSNGPACHRCSISEARQPTLDPRADVLARATKQAVRQRTISTAPQAGTHYWHVSMQVFPLLAHSAAREQTAFPFAGRHQHLPSRDASAALLNIITAHRTMRTHLIAWPPPNLPARGTDICQYPNNTFGRYLPDRVLRMSRNSRGPFFR